MNELARRKQLLLVEAGVHRAILQWHGVRWSARTAQLRELAAVGKPWLLLASGIAGLLIARNWRRLGQLLPAALSAWRTIRR